MEKRILTPNEIAHSVCEAGIARTQMRLSQTIALGILAGAFIAFGGQGALTVGQTLGGVDVGLQRLAFAVIFPVGLILIVLCGGELFTGNNLMTLGCLNLRYEWKHLLKNWSVLYLANFIGVMAIMLLILNSGLAVPGTSFAKVAAQVAMKKVNLTFLQAVCSGILCNIHVVLAVWMATGARDVISKIFACWFPIMLFVLAGYEHSIANMFYLPLGMYMGAPIGWGDILLKNLLPVTLGNLIGGAIIIPFFYHVAYMRESSGKKKLVVKK